MASKYLLYLAQVSNGGLYLLQIRQPTKFQLAGPDTVAPNYHQLKRSMTIASNGAHVGVPGARHRSESASQYKSRLRYVPNQVALTTEVLVGQSLVEVVIDIGSSDLWSAQRDPQCLEAEGRNVEASRCLLSKTFNDSLSVE